MGARLLRFLHYLAADLAHYSGLLRWWGFYRRRILRRPEVYVLGFHRVLTVKEISRVNSPPGMILKETTFAKILEYISRNGETVSLDAFLEGAGKTDSSRPRFLLTFDDGWRDNYLMAYPWLKKFGVPAVIFVSVGALETQEPFWIEQLARAWKDASRRAYIQSRLPNLLPAKERPLNLEQSVEALKHMPGQRRQQILDVLLASKENDGQRGTADKLLTWNQVAKMSRDGIAFGSHTVTHPLLTYEDDTTVKEELYASKRLLEERLGRKVRAFAYPNGDCNEAVKQRVREAGYECAFVTRDAHFLPERDLFGIRRVLLHDGNVTGPDGEFSPAMFSFTLARSS